MYQSHNLADGPGLILAHSFLVDPACARELLTRGADPNIFGPGTKSPLYGAVFGGRTSLAELLLEYGANLDPDLLFVTAAPRRQYGEPMTKFLLDKGIDPNPVSAEWGTPLHLAVYAGKPNIVKLLLDAGADPTTKSAAGTRHYPGQTPSQIAQTLSHLTPPDITQAMLNLLQS
jgi:ankyrin repeat protein